MCYKLFPKYKQKCTYRLIATLLAVQIRLLLKIVVKSLGVAASVSKVLPTSVAAITIGSFRTDRPLATKINVVN